MDPGNERRLTLKFNQHLWQIEDSFARNMTQFSNTAAQGEVVSFSLIRTLWEEKRLARRSKRFVILCLWRGGRWFIKGYWGIYCPYLPRSLGWTAAHFKRQTSQKRRTGRISGAGCCADLFGGECWNNNVGDDLEDIREGGFTYIAEYLLWQKDQQR